MYPLFLLHPFVSSALVLFDGAERRRFQLIKHRGIHKELGGISTSLVTQHVEK